MWNFVNSFTAFNHFINCPIANYYGEIYNLPFNMNTFNRFWGVATPAEAIDKLKNEQRVSGIITPINLEEQAISLVGREIYQKLICGYTEKQWGRPCSELPVSIIKRLPVRFTYDNRYFDDIYQGVPEKGYTYLIQIGRCIGGAVPGGDNKGGRGLIDCGRFDLLAEAGADGNGSFR